MTKKDLQKQVEYQWNKIMGISTYLGYEGFFPRNIGKNIEKKFADLQTQITTLKEIVNDMVDLQGQVNMLDKEQHEINKSLIELLEYRKLQEERWEMLKDYLKVEEKDYAELEGSVTTEARYLSDILDGEIKTEAVKKTKLVKIKK